MARKDIRRGLSIAGQIWLRVHQGGKEIEHWPVCYKVGYGLELSQDLLEQVRSMEPTEMPEETKRALVWLLETSQADEGYQAMMSVMLPVTKNCDSFLTSEDVRRTMSAPRILVYEIAKRELSGAEQASRVSKRSSR